MTSLIYLIIGLVLFIILLVIAIKIGVDKKNTEIEELQPLIHASGIYSVVRKSPREEVLRQKPGKEEICQYLTGQNEDINRQTLNQADKDRLVADFLSNIEANISEIEQGDKEGGEFYYFRFDDNDTVCDRYIGKGQFVTRTDIFKHGELIPPFHLGCTCSIKRHRGNENLRDTTQLRFRPLLSKDSAVPQLPNWHTIVKIPPR